MCRVNQHVAGTLTHEQKTQIDLWFTPANYDSEAVCYYWCTVDGALPEIEPSVNIDRSLTDQLVIRNELTPPTRNGKVTSTRNRLGIDRKLEILDYLFWGIFRLKYLEEILLEQRIFL